MKLKYADNLHQTKSDLRSENEAHCFNYLERI